MAVAGSPGDEKFRSLLSDLLSNVNDIRTKAEENYEGIPPAEKVFLLLKTAGAEEGVPVSQETLLAAVLLRRLFSICFEEAFSNLHREGQLQIQTSLLQIIHKIIDYDLRKKISDAIAELVGKLIDEDGNNLWPEFLTFLFDSVNSADPNLKEVALLIFATVPGVFGNQQSRYIEVIHSMLMQSLIDQTSLEVRYAAVKATASFLLIHEKEVVVQRQFSDCLNVLLQFVGQMMESSDERIDDVFKFLIELVEKCPQSFKSQTDFLFHLCLKCMSTQTSAESTRHLALEVIVSSAESAPVMIRKHCLKHIPSVIDVIFKMMSDLEEKPNWDFDEDGDDDEIESSSSVAEAALDRLACAVGGKTILPIVFNSLPNMLNSGDWKVRYVGLITVAAIGEGCYKQMLNMLPQIVEGVLPFLMDSHPRVRFAACNALGQMASDFSPNFQKKFTDKVINGLLQVFGEPISPRVQAHAGAALVNFFEDCPKQILSPYLNKIADKLEVVLNSKINELFFKGYKLVLEQVVVTIASFATSAEEKFIHYYDKFMPMLKYIIQNANQVPLKLLKGKTIECISLIGLAVGKEKFSNDAGDVMNLLLKSETEEPLSDDDPQLSYMIAAWARICQILGKGFEPYLPYVMGPVLKAANIKPEVTLVNVDEMKNVEKDEGWEYLDLGETHNFGIRTAGLEEKSIACQMLVCYARELKEAFAPYTEQTVQLMVPMLKFYFHDGVRLAAAEILPHLLEASKIRGEDYVKEMWKFILAPFLQAMESEPEPEVLYEFLGSFAQCIEVLNTQCFSNEEMIFVINLIHKKLIDHFEKSNDRAHQRTTEDYDDDLEETLEREDENDVYILSKISDVMSTLFSTYKQDFFPYFDVLLPQYIRLVDRSRPCADRQWGLCVFADLIQHGGSLSSRYQQYFLKPIIESLSDVNPDLRQTAAFCVGCIGSYGGQEYAKVCAECIPILVQMINDPQCRSEENIRATENAIVAVARCLMCNNSLINMDEMLPQLLSWLPIWEDKEESKFVFNYLCSLLETNNPRLLGNDNCNLPRIVQIIAEAFHKEAFEASSDVGERVLTLIRDIQNNQALFSLCVVTLSPQQQEALHAALTKP